MATKVNTKTKNTNNTKTKFYLESVVSIDWNVDGSLLASGDMSGLVKIWDVQKKKSIIEFEEEEIEFIKFHPTFKKYILVCQADGNSYFYSISDGNFKILVGSTGVRCISAEFLASGKEVIVLYQVGLVS